MSGDEIDETLEGLGATVETQIGLVSGSAFMSVLKDNVDTVLPILADVLMHPAFPEDKIELEKVTARSSIARRNDDPTDMGFRGIPEADLRSGKRLRAAHRIRHDRRHYPG